MYKVICVWDGGGKQQDDPKVIVGNVYTVTDEINNPKGTTIKGLFYGLQEHPDNLYYCKLFAILGSSIDELALVREKEEVG